MNSQYLKKSIYPRPPLIHGPYVAIAGLVASVLAIKSNGAISNPQFWAEDATIFFAQQLGNSLPPLAVPYAGYLHTAPRLVAWIASFMPLGWAPAIYNVAAVFISTWAIMVTGRRLGRYIPTWLVISSFLLVPTNGEVFGTVTNVQWFLQFALATCCLTPPMEEPIRRVWLRDIALLAAALTGPFSILILIVTLIVMLAFFISGKLKLDPFGIGLNQIFNQLDKRALTCIVVGALIQTCILQLFPAHGPNINHDLGTILFRTFGEIVPLHTFGQPLLPPLFWILINTAMVALLFCLREVDARRRLVVMCLVAYAIVETFVSVWMKDSRDMGNFLLGDRYFYVTKIVWWWLLWTILSALPGKTRAASIIVATLLTGCALLNLEHFRRPALVDMAWSKQVDRLKAPGRYIVPFNPGGWDLLIEVRDKPTHEDKVNGP